MAGQSSSKESSWIVIILAGILCILFGYFVVAIVVVSKLFGVSHVPVATLVATFAYWNSHVIRDTNRPLPHPGTWHILVVVVVSVLALVSAILEQVTMHFYKSKGLDFAFGSGSKSLDKSSDDPAKWLQYKARKFKDFTPVAITTRERVRPSLVDVPAKERRVDDYGFVLGYAQNDPNNPIAISSEFSMLLAGEPRSGKTAGFVIPWVSSWQGPVLTTSTKNEVLKATLLARKQVSDHIYVLSLPGVNIPEGVKPISYDICWFYEEELESLIESAERRASIFSGVASDKSQPIWESATKQIFACLLLIGFAWRHAQICYLGEDPSDARPELNGLNPETHHIDVLKSFATLDWTRDPTQTEAVRNFLIANIPGGKGAYVASYVRSVVRTFAGKAGNTEFAQTISGMIAVGLGKLNDPQIAAVFSTPWYEPVFEPEEFLAESGTLYLISRSEDSSDLAKFFSLVCNEVAAAARRRAARLGRCDPGLAMVLDEIANIAPLPNLKSYMSEGGGNGITTVAVVQSLRQLITTYGQVMAIDIVSSSNVIATFGGSKNKEDLDMFAFQAGNRVAQMSSYDKSGNLTGRSESIQPALDPNQIANMPQGWMLVKLPGCDAIMVKTVPYWNKPAYKRGEKFFQVSKWKKEWGDCFEPERRSYPFHDTSRALSYMAAYDLAMKSEKLPLAPLRIEIPIQVDNTTNDTPGPESANAEVKDAEVKDAGPDDTVTPPVVKKMKRHESDIGTTIDARRARLLDKRQKLAKNEGLTWEPDDGGIKKLFSSIPSEDEDEANGTK